MFCNEVKESVSAILRYDWSRENIRHTGITWAFVGFPAPTKVIIVEYVFNDSVLNHFNLVNILSVKGSKRKPHIQLGDGFCKQLVPFYLSYVGIGKPTKTLCVTVHGPLTSLKVSLVNFISWTESWLLKVVYAISVTRALSRTSWMFVAKQVPVCSFKLLIVACVGLRIHCLCWKRWVFLSVCYFKTQTDI